MSQFLNVPIYVADPTTGETVTGYNLQSAAPVAGVGTLPPSSGWTTVTGSPFSTNTKIFDPNGVAETYYRVQPIRQVTINSTVYTLDTPWSKPFKVSTVLYDAAFTRWLLPALRFTYLNDAGIMQTNGTIVTETTGAGQGQWIFDGKTTRFQLQYVMNDDPIRVLDGFFSMLYLTGGTGSPVQMLPDVDYTVDVRGGTVTFKTAPATNDYARLDFRRTDFVNEDLLVALSGAINVLSSFGLSGYETIRTGNLVTLNQNLAHADLEQLLCKAAIFSMREGATESALRASMAFRDGVASVDPYPSRALEFLVAKHDVTEKSLRRMVNSYIRTVTIPKQRGEFDIYWDLTQLTPLTAGMFAQMPYGSYGTMSSGLGVAAFPWYV